MRSTPAQTTPDGEHHGASAPDGEHPPLPGGEWAIGPDGMPVREAARLVLLDAAGRALLVRGHDAHDVERTWWFTVGGGIEPGEDPVAAAVRELHEETGLRLAVADIAGPVATRSAVFDFFARSVRQREVFFVAHLDREVPQEELVRHGWTDVERAFMDELAWWSADDLADVAIEVFPRALPDLVRWLAPGWDGTLRDLGHEGEGTA